MLTVLMPIVCMLNVSKLCIVLLNAKATLSVASVSDELLGKQHKKNST